MNSKVKHKPLIGILTTTSSNSPHTPFGSRTGWIRQLVRAGSIRGKCYAFTPTSIDWTRKTVSAWAYSGNTGWHRRTMPLPEVVYNRLPGRRAEKSEPILRLKSKLSDHQIPIFNWSFFEKNDMHRRLSNSPDALRHIPETIPAPSDRDIRGLLMKHRHVYLKPAFGSLGIGIYRMTYSSSDGYLLRFRKNGRTTVMHWDSFAKMMHYLHRRSGKLRNHIVQQGIDLVQIDGSPLDFRFHLNKTRNNRWTVAGIGAKRAARGGVTTHIHSGGSVYAPLVALEKVYDQEKARSKLQQAKNVAISLAEAVERNYPHLLGELGLDLGIDRDGHIWMFEVNSKPGRSIYKHPALRKDGRSTLRHLLNYCAYLSKAGHARRVR